MLQLGLSPEAYKNINVPILKLLTRKANWAFWADKATGTSKGTNTPQVNPIVDLVGVVGKNLFDPITVFQGGLTSTTGTINTTLLTRVCSQVVKLNPLTQFKMKVNNTDYKIRNWAFYNNDVWISSGSFDIQVQEFTSTIPSNCNGVRISFCKNVLTENLTPQEFQQSQTQLELGTAATAYKPYGKSNGLLTGFAFTGASGYVDVVAPNGKTVTGIQGDGVNDVIVLPNNPSIDITGTGDFAIGVVFKTGETLNGGSAIFATGDGVAVPQILLQTYANSYIAGRVGGNFYIFAGAGTLAINTFYQAILYRKSGVLKLRLQKVVVYSENNVIPITSTSIKRIGAIPTNAGGTTHSDFFNLWLGTIKITNGAITPFTEEELIKDWDSFCSKVYGL